MGYSCIMAYGFTVFCYCFSGTLLRMWVFPFRLRPRTGAFGTVILGLLHPLRKKERSTGLPGKLGQSDKQQQSLLWNF